MLPAGLKVKKSHLFGSFAKETQKEESDIDIALVLRNMSDFFDIQILLRQIRRQIDLRLEPHPIAEDEFNADPQTNAAVVCQSREEQKQEPGRADKST